MLPSHLHHVGAQDDFILEVLLVLVQRVVLVDVLYVRRQCGRRAVGLRLVLRSGRVALGAVIVFVARQHGHLLLVEVGAAIVVEVIARRVVQRRERVCHPLCQHGLAHRVAQGIHIVLVRSLAVEGEEELILGAQSVQAHILLLARPRLVGEGGYCRGGLRHTPPHRGVRATHIFVGDRQPVLKRFLAVAQDILRDITEVDVHLALVAVGVGQRGVHQPELDILDVRFLEVGVVQFAHHTAPALLRVGQFAVCAYLARYDIVRTALLGVVTQVQHAQFRVGVRHLLLARVNLRLIDDTRPVVGHHRHIVLDMRGGVRLRVAKDGVHRVPRQQRTVLAVLRVVRQFRLLEHRRGRSQEPIRWIMHINVRGSRLKIIDIRSPHRPYILGMPGYQVCKLCVDLEGRRGGRAYPRNLVNGVRQPLHIGLPTAIHTPDGVRQRLAAGVHLRGQRTLPQVHYRSAYHQLRRELIFQMRPEERLPLQREGRLVLQLHIHVRPRLQDRLIEDGYRSHHVVHRVVHILYQRRAAGGYRYAPSRDIHRVEPYLAAAGAFVLSRQVELVLLRHLLRHHQRGVVQLLEDIFLCYRRVAYRLLEVAAEGLQHREDNAPVARIYRQSLHKVELPVGVGVVLAIQAVEVHHAQQLLAFYRALRQVLHLRPHRVVAVLDIEFELLLRNAARTQRVDVLHHQVPCARTLLDRRIIAALQQFEYQRVGCPQFLAAVRGELTHLIHLPAVGVLVCHRQHLVLVQRLLQRDEAQCAVQRVLAARQQPRGLHFLVVLAAVHPFVPLQHAARLLNIANTRQPAHLVVQAVGLVVRHLLRCARPTAVQRMHGRLA